MPARPFSRSDLPERHRPTEAVAGGSSRRGDIGRTPCLTPITASQAPSIKPTSIASSGGAARGRSTSFGFKSGTTIAGRRPRARAAPTSPVAFRGDTKPGNAGGGPSSSRPTPPSPSLHEFRSFDVRVVHAGLVAGGLRVPHEDHPAAARCGLLLQLGLGRARLDDQGVPVRWLPRRRPTLHGPQLAFFF